MNLTELRVILADVFPRRPDQVTSWIESPNQHLGGCKPKDLVDCGHGLEVFALARALAGWPTQPAYPAATRDKSHTAEMPI